MRSADGISMFLHMISTIGYSNDTKDSAKDGLLSIILIYFNNISSPNWYNKYKRHMEFSTIKTYDNNKNNSIITLMGWKLSKNKL